MTSSSGPDPVLGDVLITADEIAARLCELAPDVDADYEGRDLVLLGVLRGAMMVTRSEERRVGKECA